MGESNIPLDLFLVFHEIHFMRADSNKKNRLYFLGALLCLSILLCCQREKVENLGIFGASRQKSVLGQDGCTPIPLGNIIMWTFGDTILGTWKGELTASTTFEDAALMSGMLSNSLAFTDVPNDETVTNLNFEFYKQNGKVAAFIKNYPYEDPRKWRLWPVDGILIGSTVYVYYYIILIDKNLNSENQSILPFKVKGTGIAEWKKPSAWKIGDPVDFRRGPVIFSEKEPVFGDSVEQQGDYLYIIGHGRPVKNRVPSYLARVTPAGIKDRRAYRFLDDREQWSPGIESAGAFFNDVMGETSLSFNPYIKKYFIIYCGFDGNIKYVDFENFASLKDKNAKVLYTPPPLPRIKSRPFLYYYSGKEIFHSQKYIYSIYINPAIYQPVLLRIPYSVIPE
jgi:hypothetical protein